MCHKQWLLGLCIVASFIGCRSTPEKVATVGPVLLAQSAASQIYDSQRSVNQCVKDHKVRTLKLDSAKEVFINLMSSACSEEELGEISHYWLCFISQMECPLKSAPLYQKAGNNCLPLPKLSEKCCSAYELSWIGSSDRIYSSCGE